MNELLKRIQGLMADLMEDLVASFRVDCFPHRVGGFEPLKGSGDTDDEIALMGVAQSVAHAALDADELAI